MLPFSEWLDYAELLREGTGRRHNHTCGPGKTLYVAHDSKGYNAYCYRCADKGFKAHGQRTLEQLTAAKEARAYAASQSWNRLLVLPGDYTSATPVSGRLWYYRAGIPDAIARLYRIGWSPSQCRVILPVYDDSGTDLVFVQGRAVRAGQEPKYLNTRARGRAGVGFFSDPRTIGYFARPGQRVAGASDQGCQDAPGSRIVICEDILSAIRVGMSVQSCAICGTKLDDAFAQRLSKYQRVTFWLDGDAAGVKGRLQGMRTLQLMHPGEVDYIDSPRDPKCYSQEEIEQWLRRV